MTTTTSKLRDASLVSDRKLRPMMGIPVWEALPARDVPYRLSDPFIVVDAVPETRYLLMAGKPYGEEPRFNGPFVD
jgi:hypothetical protein